MKALSDQAIPFGNVHGLHGIIDLQFFKNALPVRVYRMYADFQHRANFLTQFSGADHLKDFLFPVGQVTRYVCLGKLDKLTSVEVIDLIFHTRKSCKTG